MSENAFDV